MANITNLTGYTWVGYDNIVVDTNATYALNFTCGDLIYTSMAFSNPSLKYGSTTVNSGSSWSSSTYKTIKITGGDDSMNSVLIAWFKENGTLSKPITTLVGTSWKLNDTPAFTSAKYNLTFVAGGVKYTSVTFGTNSIKFDDTLVYGVLPIDEPALTLTDSVLTWTVNARAESYTLYKDGASYKTNVSTPLIINESGTYQVQAIGDGVNYSSSELSNSVTAELARTITGTGVNCLINGVASYSGTCEVTGSLTLTITADGTSYAVPETLTVQNATYTRTSNKLATLVITNPSGNITFTATGLTTTAAPTNLSVSDTTLSFDPVDGATSYEIYAKDSSGVETDLGEYTPE